MMLLCGQSNRVWHYLAGKYSGSVGLLISPAYRTKVPIDDWMPYVLDNGVFKERDKWDSHEWFAMLAWAQSLRDQCAAAGVAFWMKQLGGHPNARHELADLPAGLRTRQLP